MFDCPTIDISDMGIVMTKLLHNYHPTICSAMYQPFQRYPYNIPLPMEILRYKLQKLVRLYFLMFIHDCNIYFYIVV